MLLYLVRHAIAFEPDPSSWPEDRGRPLTHEGVKKFRKAARGLKALAPAVDVVLSSSYVRAWQTAQILEEKAGWPAPEKCRTLEAGGSPEDTLAVLQPHQARAAVALVGHEPTTSATCAYLLTGSPGGMSIDWKKGGVACLQLDGALRPGAATLLWLATPGLLRGLAA